jgi:uncharacterized peroxidase-related enzyme
MSRLQHVELETATGKAKDILTGVKQAIGTVPNIFKSMANAPEAFAGFLGLKNALDAGKLPGELAEKIALTVGQINDCTYCLAAHTMIGGGAGIEDAELLAARKAQSPDAKEQAALEFVKAIVETKGNVSDAALASVRAAGYDDGEIVELVFHTAVNILTNYFNHVNDTSLDFPQAPALT